MATDEPDDLEPNSAENPERTCALPGDDLILDARAQITDGITIEACTATIWPELVRMIRAEADPSPAILLVDEPRVIVLGGLYDHAARRYLPFDAARPTHFWHATWALVLAPIDEDTTRVLVRARVSATPDAVKWSSVWMHPFHAFLERGALVGLRERASGRAAPGRTSARFVGHAAGKLRDEVLRSLRRGRRRNAHSTPPVSR